MVLSIDTVRNRKNVIPAGSLDDDHQVSSDEQWDGRSLCMQDGYCFHSYSDAKVCSNCKKDTRDCSCEPEEEECREECCRGDEQDAPAAGLEEEEEDVQMEPVRRAEERFQKVKLGNKRKLRLGTMCIVTDNPVRKCGHCRRLANNRNRTLGLKRQRGAFGGHESRTLSEGEGYAHSRPSWKMSLQKLRNRQQRYQGRAACRRSTSEFDDTGYPAHGTEVEEPEEVIARQRLYFKRQRDETDEMEDGYGVFISYSKDTHYQVGNARPGLCRMIKTQGESKLSRQKREDAERQRRDAEQLRQNRQIAEAAVQKRSRWCMRTDPTVDQIDTAYRKGRCPECLRAKHRHREYCSREQD